MLIRICKRRLAVKRTQKIHSIKVHTVRSKLRAYCYVNIAAIKTG